VRQNFIYEQYNSAFLDVYRRNAPLTPTQLRYSDGEFEGTASRPRRFGSLSFPKNPTSSPTNSSPLPREDDIPVKILSPSRNSRTILGSIFIPSVTADDVWSILTDYDRLSVHVPNLVESARRNDDGGTPAGSGKNGAGCAGDGSYRCRLYQRGAQKIVGFTFGASVTMAMEEKIVDGYEPVSVSGLERGSGGLGPAVRRYIGGRQMINMDEYGVNGRIERQILFKCVDSRFFGAFDGVWKVVYDPSVSNEGVMLEYEVFVKPKGPVPVAALEWRIKEDVPVNLRAVKKASMEVGLDGVMNHRTRGKWSSVSKLVEEGIRDNTFLPNGYMSENDEKLKYSKGKRKSVDAVTTNSSSKFFAGSKPIFVDWEKDETMAKYLPRKNEFE